MLYWFSRRLGNPVLHHYTSPEFWSPVGPCPLLLSSVGTGF